MDVARRPSWPCFAIARDLCFTRPASRFVSFSLPPPIGGSRTPVQTGLGDIRRQQVLPAFPPHAILRLKTILGHVNDWLVVDADSVQVYTAGALSANTARFFEPKHRLA